MRRTLSILLAAFIAFASLPPDAVAAYGRAVSPAGRPMVLTVVPVAVVAPALALTATPLAGALRAPSVAPSAPLVAAPGLLPLPAAARAPLAAASAVETAPAPADVVPERQAAAASVLFDQAVLSVASDAPEAPDVPAVPATSAGEVDGLRLERAAARPRRLMTHRLLGSRPSGESALARAGRMHYKAPADDFGEAASPLMASALTRSVAVGLVFAALEFTGGVLTNNAALKADALHLAGDRLLDGTGLLALFLARRPPNARQTYGFIKAEAVSALLGALVIAGVAAGMVPDAWHGLTGVWAWLFSGGPALAGATWAVAGYAVLGLTSNLFSGYLLMRHRGGSMTARAAFLHVMADAMGSAGIILTTALGLFLGWTFLQPFVVAAIVYLILRTAWELGRPAWNVLMDATPAGVDLDELEAEFLAVPGVAGVHDLHVRMLNGSSSELVAKAAVRPDVDRDAVLAALQAVLREKYKISHATIQLELAK